jgi:uncharacterized protein YndB with AHSA1/START domain
VAADSLVKEIYIDAPAEVIFTFLTDAAKMVRWMGITAAIATLWQILPSVTASTIGEVQAATRKVRKAGRRCGNA